jgi:hypothetical protein
MNAIEMEPGNLYRIIFHQESGNGQWYRREMTAVYLGFNQQNKEWQFSLRPVLGTTSLSKRHNPIERIELVEKNIPHKYRDGVRDQALASLIRPSVSLGPVKRKQ